MNEQEKCNPCEWGFGFDPMSIICTECLNLNKQYKEGEGVVVQGWKYRVIKVIYGKWLVLEAAFCNPRSRKTPWPALWNIRNHEIVKTHKGHSFKKIKVEDGQLLIEIIVPD